MLSARTGASGGENTGAGTGAGRGVFTHAVLRPGEMSEAHPVSEDSDGAGRRPEERVADAAETESWEFIELDSVEAQDDSGSIRPAWPQPWARRAGVEQSTEVTPVVHVPTGAVLFLPPGTNQSDILD